FSSRRRHTRFSRDWSSDVCSSDLTSEDDFSFLRNYLTPGLVKELGLFAYGPACSCPPHTPRPCPRCGDVAIRSRDVDAVVEAILKPRYNYGAPKVVVTDTAGGVLRLEHDEPGTVLDREYAEKRSEEHTSE